MEFPSNSQMNRSRPADESKPELKPEAIRRTTSIPIKRKKPFGSRLKEMLVGEDAKSAVAHIFSDVMLPAARDMIADAGSQFLERLIFGEPRSASRRTGVRGPTSGSAGYVSYNRFANRGPAREEPRQMSRQARGGHNFDEIILHTKVEADDTIDQMFELVNKYDWISVAELYTIVGITPEYVDQNWGWTTIEGLSATRISDGYLLNLSRPEPRPRD